MPVQSTKFSCRVGEPVNGRAVLLIQGDLSRRAWVMQAGEAVLGILEQEGVHEVVIDLSGVTGFDMQSVASWVGISRTAHSLGGRLVIINPSDAVGDVLDSAGIDWTRDPT